MASKRADLGNWADASAAIGLDHPAVLRAPGLRKLAEEAHRLHELRRSAHSRIGELDQLRTMAQDQLDAATLAGLVVLQSIQRELETQSQAMDAAIKGLARSLEPEVQEAGVGGEAPTPSIDAIVERHQLEEQFDGLLDLLTMQGLYNPRGRTVQIHGRGGGLAKEMPTFDEVAKRVLTPNVCGYLAGADRLQLVLTPLADTRVIKGIGKIIGFNDYTVIGSDDRSEISRFVEQVSTSSGQSVVDHLLDASPLPGLAVAVYAEDFGEGDGIEGLGLSLEESTERVRASVVDAAAKGVAGRPMSPPEYMMLQALRHRSGTALLDDSKGSDQGTETWFPGHRFSRSAGTLVSRRMAHSLRFRLDEVGRGAENRGHRMVYAPAA
ncbi:MAG: hypothetical protein R2707_05630 [Acidimicrobiales bacterium]